MASLLAQELANCVGVIQNGCGRLIKLATVLDNAEGVKFTLEPKTYDEWILAYSRVGFMADADELEATLKRLLPLRSVKNIEASDPVIGMLLYALYLRRPNSIILQDIFNFTR